MKNLIGREAVGALADRLVRGDTAFDRAAFVRAANRGLSKLELKHRVRHIAATLRRHLDPDYERALAHIVATLGPPLTGTDRVTAQFADWPLCQFVEEYGGGHFAASLAGLRELTQRFSAEWAIRPFLEAQPERTLVELRGWLDDTSPHVRRLCSEGTRPRLPWGAHLSRFRVDPSECQFILDALLDDEELYVRRSVANHLNDIAKDHPEAAIATARAWMEEPSETRAWVVRHALRTLIKRGHPDALALRGYGKAKVDVELSVRPKRVRIGESVTIDVALRSRARAPQALLVDYAVHFRRTDGSCFPKVFKWSELELGGGGRVTLTKRHAFRPLSTRKLLAGVHRIEIWVNGEARAEDRVRVVR